MANPGQRETSRRETFGEWLSRMEREDPGHSEFWELYAQIEQETANAASFRWDSQHTQNAQDRVMCDYWQYVKAAHAPEEDLDMGDEKAKKLCFPQDHEQLFEQLRAFISSTLAKASQRPEPGFIAGNSALMSHFKSLKFWVQRVYPEIGQEPPHPSQIHKIVTEATKTRLDTGTDNARRAPGRS